MTIRDKRDLLARITELDSPSLELGCGEARKWPRAISIDRRESPAVDVVGDVFEVLAEIPDRAVAGVYSSHFMEHVDDLGALLREVVRVLRVGGRLEVVVPHFSNPYFYSDPTHRNFFGLYTFSYLCHDDVLQRRVPHYDEPLPLRLREVELVFKSPPPFYLRYALKRAFGVLVNLTTYTRELYEENLTGLVACYSVRYVLERTAPPAESAESAASGAP